jgi:hypothetical protein
MTRADLEHVIRAAAEVAGDHEIVIVGSQAVLGQYPNAPAALLVSMEADVFPLNDSASADAIDGALGDGSQFHAEFGYYAHGVGPETALLPNGWRDRLVPIEVPRIPTGKGYVTGFCLEIHDLVASKCAANRERDWSYVQAVVQHDLVDRDTLMERVRDLPGRDALREGAQSMLRGIFARVDGTGH